MNYGLVFENVYGVIKFYKKTRLKSYTDINDALKITAKKASKTVMILSNHKNLKNVTKYNSKTVTNDKEISRQRYLSPK